MRPDTIKQRDALGKALRVLGRMVEAAASGKQWGVRELAESLELSPATAHRVLLDLAAHGLVQRHEGSGPYELGLEFCRLALKVQAGFALRNAGIPVMQALVADCNETAFMGLYDPFRLQMMFVAVVNSSNPLRYIVPVHEWVPVHAGASGLAIMAFLPDEERRAILAQTPLVRLTERTITDPDMLERELEQVRVRGYAVSRGQRNVGAVAVAAPIWGPDGKVKSDLIVSLPEYRFSAKMESALARLVIQHAKLITERLGARAPAPRQQVARGRRG